MNTVPLSVVRGVKTSASLFQRASPTSDVSPSSMVADGISYEPALQSASGPQHQPLDRLGAVRGAATGPEAKLEVAGTMSGSSLIVNKSGTGTGQIVVSGSTGGQICIFDNDTGGYTVITALNGALSSRIAFAGECQ